MGLHINKMKMRCFTATHLPHNQNSSILSNKSNVVHNAQQMHRKHYPVAHTCKTLVSGNALLRKRIKISLSLDKCVF